MQRHKCYPSSRLHISRLVKTISIAVILFFIAFPSGSPASFRDKAQKRNKRHVLNEVIVRFIPDIKLEERKEIRRRFNASLVRSIKSIRVEYWKFKDKMDAEIVCENLKKLHLIEHAEPNYLLGPQNTPNDSSFDDLWYLHNTGQIVNGRAGFSGSDISSVEAWDIETGNRDVVIAIIDSGVAFDHPDLSANIWANLDEIPDNDIDDDGNGFIDDTVGWDFVNSDNNPSDYSKDVYGDGHGTHVAGIIAGKGNNNIGITGVMWDAQIMPLQVFDLFQKNTFESAVIQSVNIIQAIEYAVDNGAKIINCSFGGSTFSQFQYDVINYAHQAGVLVVAAAGNNTNDNDANPFYPSSYDLPNIISVAATNESDELALYSNYGATSVDVTAPGGSAIASNIYSTIPPERVILFYDDFESGGVKWTTTGIYESWSIAYNYLFGSNVVQDSTLNYYNSENSNITTALPIIAENCKGIHLQFTASWELEYDYDFVYFEGSEDGINYDIIDFGTGFSNGVYEVKYWTNDYEVDSFYLRFRLASDSLYNYDGVYLDNLMVTGVPWNFTGNEYGYKSGTSMAAPVVAGIAGLIFSHNPSATHLEVKNAIIDSVDKISSLDGLLLSGGRVNAYRAVSLQNNKSKKAMPWIPLLLLDEE